MPHDTSLIATVAMGFVLAFGFGFGAAKLRLPGGTSRRDRADRRRDRHRQWR